MVHHRPDMMCRLLVDLPMGMARADQWRMEWWVLPRPPTPPHLPLGFLAPSLPHPPPQRHPNLQVGRQPSATVCLRYHLPH